MKKKLLTLLIAIFVMGVATGCGIKQTNTKTTLEAGEEFVFHAKDFFNGKELKDEDFEVDTSSLDVTKVGKQKVTVTYNKKSYEIEVVVEDTKKPSVDQLHKYVFTNDIDNIDIANIVEYYDASECTVSLGKFNKLDDLKVLTDTELKKYTNELSNDSEEDLLKRADNTAEEEGIYNAVLSIADPYNNVAAVELIVVYDKTAPNNEFEYDNITVEQEDVSEVPTVNVEDLKFTDNVDGVANEKNIEVTLTETEEGSHVYDVTATCKDRAGNETTISYQITVEEKKEETTTNNSNQSGTQNSSSNNGQNQSNNNTSSGNGTITVNGFTINVEDMDEGYKNAKIALANAGYNNVIYADNKYWILTPYGDASGYDSLRGYLNGIGYDCTGASGGIFDINSASEYLFVTTDQLVPLQ